MVAEIIDRKANPYATTTLEAIVAAMPKMPYISPGWVQPGDPWYMPKVTC